MSPAKVSGNPCFVSHPRREPHRRVLRARAGGTTLSCEPDPGPAHAGICGEGVHQGGYPRAGVGVFESVPSLVPKHQPTAPSPHQPAADELYEWALRFFEAKAAQGKSKA